MLHWGSFFFAKMQMPSMCDNNELLFTDPKSYTHTLPLLKTSAFPVSPDNAGTSSYTSWFSGWRGRKHSLVTRCSLPPLPSFFKLLLHSVFLPHSSAVLCHLLFPHCSHLCLLLPPKQGHTDSGSGKKKKGYLLKERALEQTNKLFSAMAGCSPERRIFSHVVEMV